MKMTVTDSPRVYVACLAAYNNGILHGAWIDADQDSDSIQAEVEAMLQVSPAWKLGDICEEWAIHDYEGFYDIALSEWEDFDTVSALATAITQHGGAFAAFYDYYGELNLDQFEDYYCGTYADEEDFVYQTLDDLGSIDAWESAGLLNCYIDFKAITRDWFIDSYFSAPAPDHQIFVFHRY